MFLNAFVCNIYVFVNHVPVIVKEYNKKNTVIQSLLSNAIICSVSVNKEI